MGGILSLFSKTVSLPHPVETYFNKISRYQVFVLLIICTSKWPLFYHMLSHLVIAPKQNFYCGGEAVKHGSKMNYTGAKGTCPCKEKVHWDTNVFTKTVPMQYDLFCDKDWLIKYTKTILYVGLLFGALSFGILADKIGRIPSTAIAFLMTGLSGCLVPAMPEIISHFVMRFIEGVGLGGAVVTTYVLMIEYCGPRNRESISAIFHLPLNFSHMTLAGVSYFLRNCDHVMYAMSIPCLIYGFLYLVILESPKWLVDSVLTEKANKVMTKICKFNKKPCEDMKGKIDAFVNRHSQALKKVSIKECFKHKQLIKTFIAMALLYFTVGMSYYGVSQYISEMFGDFHLNLCISGAALIPGTIVSIFLLKFMKRKPFVLICLIGSAVPLLVAIFMKPGLARVIVASISNCFYFMLFIVVFLYGCEVFPTEARNSMLGLLSVISRIGQFLAPIVNDIKVQYIEIIFPILSILSGLLLVIPPETKNVLLPATIEDSLAMSKKKKDKTTQTSK